MKPFAQWWIVVAIGNLWNFIYTEVGTALKLLKTPDGKFSAKRVIALALAGDALISGIPHDLWTLLVFLAKILTAAGLMLVAELTKT